MFTELLRMFDAAATPHGVDRYVELVAPAWSSTEVRGRVVQVERQTPGTVTLTIRPNHNWTAFEAGQHTQVTVEIDGVRHTRCYSMASSAHAGDGTFELTIKAQPDGLVSNHLVHHAEPGMVLGLTTAMGEFTLPGERPDHLLLISGGSGITPVLSMLRTLEDEGYAGRTTFLHYARSARDMTYREGLPTAVKVFSDDPAGGDLAGLVSAEQLDAADPDWRTAETFLCGPAPLMDAVGEIYVQAGCSARLHTEQFTLPMLLSEAGGSVRFNESGLTVESDGRPLLLQAEAAGLNPASGCRMGICHTCTRSLVCGTVRDAVTGDLTEDPGSPVRICVSVPVGDVAIDL
jgi:ferredoxin-NADP reductase